MSDLWQCQTCGAKFPHIRGDEDIAQCSRCVEVEVLLSIVRPLQADILRLRRALEQAAGMKTIKGARKIAADALEEPS